MIVSGLRTDTGKELVFGVDALISYNECVWLKTQAARFDTVLEIGSWKGASTTCLLRGARRTVYAVDTFLGSKSERETSHAEAATGDIYQQFMESVGDNEKLKVIRMESVAAAELFEDQEIDMVFIDGDHEYEACRADFVAWSRKCKKLLCGHDAEFDGVRRVLEEFSDRYSFQRGADSIWYAEITA